eukprot:360908-Chlamydomonas_euryale.AAC.2
MPVEADLQGSLQHTFVRRECGVSAAGDGSIERFASLRPSPADRIAATGASVQCPAAAAELVSGDGMFELHPWIAPQECNPCNCTRGLHP